MRGAQNGRKFQPSLGERVREYCRGELAFIFLGVYTYEIHPRLVKDGGCEQSTNSRVLHALPIFLLESSVAILRTTFYVQPFGVFP